MFNTKKNIYSSANSRNFYKGRSFNFNGEWKSGNHYFNDEWKQDFIVFDGILLCCNENHISSAENKPEIKLNEDKTPVLVCDKYWKIAAYSSWSSFVSVEVTTKTDRYGRVTHKLRFNFLDGSFQEFNLVEGIYVSSAEVTGDEYGSKITLTFTNGVSEELNIPYIQYIADNVVPDINENKNDIIKCNQDISNLDSKIKEVEQDLTSEIEEDEYVTASAIAYTNDRIDKLNQSKQDILEFDESPIVGSSNPVTSNGIVSYVQQELYSYNVGNYNFEPITILGSYFSGYKYITPDEYKNINDAFLSGKRILLCDDNISSDLLFTVIARAQYEGNDAFDCLWNCEHYALVKQSNN